MVRFRMNKIAVKQFAILAKELPADNVSLETRISFQYAIENKLIACVASFNFCHEDKVLVVISCMCEFNIHSEDWGEFIKGDAVEFPNPLLELLALHTVGTTRGVLFCKTEGTAFSGLILPPIDVKEIIER